MDYLGYIMFEGERMHIDHISLRGGCVVMRASCTAQFDHYDLFGVYSADIYGPDDILVAKCPTTFDFSERIRRDDLWLMTFNLESSNK